MQQLKALFKKEFGSYFRSSFAYIVFFMYLFVSIGVAFYFGSYLKMHDTSVYSLFYLQPVVLMAFIPALTMRLWSDEFKNGTAEFLLTQPISDYKPVIAKYISCLSLFMVMNLCLLPFIFYTASRLELDVGAVFCSFLGLWLYVTLFCALGCFISSLTKYVIISYSITVFVSALWVFIPNTRLYNVYTNFLFAHIGWSDVLYFVVFAIVFIWLNILVLEYRRSGNKNKRITFYVLGLFSIAAAVIFNVALHILFEDYKADFTSRGQYTLRPISLNIAKSVDIPLSCDVYISKDLKSHNPEYYYYYQQTKRLIEKYEKASNGMIKVNLVEVEPFSELEKNIISSGLYYDENAQGIKNYFGAIIRDNEGHSIVIRQFLPQRSGYFETDIDKALFKMVNQENLKTIGVYLDPRQNLDKFNGFMLNLEDDYDVISVSEDVYEISTKLDLLILINPKEIPLSFVYAIDQYIANGGRAVIFFDIVTKGQSDLTNDKQLNVVTILDQLGVLLDGEMFDDAVAIGDYSVFRKKLYLNKALGFSVDNRHMKVDPAIMKNDSYVAAVLKGRYKSAFAFNPLRMKKLEQQMMPHTIQGAKEATVALVGDVDIIENYAWISSSSADENPYSVINSSSNMEIIRRLIDNMIDNNVYGKTPDNTDYENLISIDEQISADVFMHYATDYEKIVQKLSEIQQKLLQKSGGNYEQFQNLMQVDQLGLDFGVSEHELESITYAIKQQYSAVIYRVIILNVFIWSCLATLLLWLIVWVYDRRKKYLIKEKFYE